MEKVTSILKKLYQIRLKVNKKDTPILNLSLLFSLACLIFAPHMTVVGVIASLLLGYQISVDTQGEEFGGEHLEEKIRNAAQTVKTTVSSAAQAVKTEIDKASANKAKEAGSSETKTAPAAEPAAEPAEAPAAKSVNPDEIPVTSGKATNADVLEELSQHENDFQSNPAATTFHSAYSATADSVPTIQFPVETPAEEYPSGAAHQQQ